jgi:hypothetical protein
MTSDLGKLDAYRKQLRSMPPGLVFLAWQGESDLDPDDLIDEFKKREAEIITREEES